MTDTRCPAANPVTMQRCHKTPHGDLRHAVWTVNDDGDECLLHWDDAPVGPQTEVECRAAAWELNGSLGVDAFVVAFNRNDEVIVSLNTNAVYRWWDGLGHERQVELTRSFLEHSRLLR